MFVLRSYPAGVAYGLPAAAALAAFTLGCGAPARIEPGLCGNGVLEPGEACDTFPDPGLGEGTACSGCRYVCDAPVARCPIGWGCGDDGLCRRASGAFTATAVIPEAAAELRVGDMDGDGRPDVFGVGSRGSWTRFGAPDLAFAEGITGVSALEAGRPIYADLTADGLVDMITPLSRGFVVQAGHERRVWEPISQASFEVDLFATGGLVAVPIRTDAAGPFHDFIVVAASDGLVGLLLLGADFSSSDVLLLDLPYAIADLRGLAVGDLDSRAPGQGEDLVVVFGNERRARRFESGRGPGPWGAFSIAADGEIPLDEAVPAGAGVALADLDGDGANDLVAPLAGGLGYLSGDGAGDFRGGWVSLAGSVGLGWPLAIGDLDGDRRDDLVLATGVYANVGDALVLRAAPPTGDPFGSATIGDFNRDGIADVAAGLAARGRFYLMLGTLPGILNPVAFETDTRNPTRALRAGDFDGDGVDDVALAEPSLREDEDRLSILFGQTAGPWAEPAFIARLEPVRRLEPAQLPVPVPTIPTDVATDLVVQIVAPDNRLGLYIHFGDTRRTITSGFDLGADSRAVFRGRFRKGGADAEPELLAFTTGASLHCYPWSNRAQLLPADGAYFRAGARRCLPAPRLESGDFPPRCALWTAGDVDGDGLDEAVALGLGTEDCGPARLLLGDVRGKGALLRLETTTADFAELADPVALELVDGDGDGALDLLAAFAGAPGVALFWNDGGRFQADRRAVAPDLDGALALGATTLDLDGDGRRELIVGTELGVHALEIQDRQLTIARPGVPLVAVGGRPFAADVNRDGLEDLLVAGTTVTIHLANPRDELAGTPGSVEDR